MKSILALTFTVSAVVALPHPSKAFLKGFYTGFFGKNSHLEGCLEDVPPATKDAGALLGDFKSRNFTKIPQDLAQLFEDAKTALGDCKAVPQDLEPILDAYKHCHNASDIFKKIKADILKNDAAMLDELEGAFKYCSFQKPDAEHCGHLIGEGSRQLVVGDTPQLLAEAKAKPFLKGLAKAMIGDETDVDDCAKDADKCARVGKALIADLKNRNFTKVVGDIQTLVGAFQHSVSDCKAAVADLAPYKHIMDNVTKPHDLYEKLKKNALANDEAVLDSFEDAAKYCTFQSPDGEKCGESVGTPIRLILIGKSAVVV